MTYVFEDGIWRNISNETQIGWSRGGTNIFGDVIPVQDSWGNAVSVAAEDLGYGAITGLYTVAGYDSYKVVKDLFKRRKVDISNYDRYIPKQSEMVDPKYQQGQHTYIGGPSRRTSNSGDTTMYDAGGNAGYSQLRYRKKVVGKRKRPYNVVKRFVQRMKNDCICRWQSLSSWGSTTASMLSQWFKIASETESEVEYMTLPVYCFNLSGQPIYQAGTGAGGGPDYTHPMYRLRKRLTAPIPENRQFVWVSVGGEKNNEDGNAGTSKPWNLEHVENHSENQAKLKSDDYTHDWSDIKIMLQGTRKYPVRVHVYVVQFLTDGVGPLRESATAGVYDENPVEDEIIGNTNYFWDKFLLPKVVHPLAQTKKVEVTDRRIRILMHDVVNLAPELSISEDLQPHQVYKHIFYKNGTHYKGDGQSQTGAADLNLNLDLKPEFHDADGAEASFGIVDRNRDRWLMLVAENYVKDGTGVDNIPSFDINVRSKYTLYDI